MADFLERAALSRLRILNEAFSEGLISAEEYQRHKQILLAGLSTLPTSSEHNRSDRTFAPPRRMPSMDPDEVLVAHQFFDDIEDARTVLNLEASLEHEPGNEFAFGYDDHVLTPEDLPPPRRPQPRPQLRPARQPSAAAGPAATAAADPPTPLSERGHARVARGGLGSTREFFAPDSPPPGVPTAREHGAGEWTQAAVGSPPPAAAAPRRRTANLSSTAGPSGGLSPRVNGQPGAATSKDPPPAVAAMFAATMRPGH